MQKKYAQKDTYVLVIGAGSMGKRRIRCLQQLGDYKIFIYDNSEKAAKETRDMYNVTDISNDDTLELILRDVKFSAMFICVPPLTKQKYINIANSHNIPCFCEADIITYDGDYFPSRTLVFHPAIRKIKQLVKWGSLGNIYTFNYYLGQHIRDWHKGADYTNYYAAQAATGACREMFCFEIAWLSWIFGNPIDAVGFIGKKLNDSQISADDLYSSVIKFRSDEEHINTVKGTFSIDILSRPAVRELRIVGEKGTLTWNWSDNYVTLSGNDFSQSFHTEVGNAADGYNKNIPEQMYIDEVKIFMDEVTANTSADMYYNPMLYFYTKEEEETVTALLELFESKIWGG